MYHLNPDVVNALHEYRRAEIVRLVGDARVSRGSLRQLRWPPWPPLRLARREQVAGGVAAGSA